MSVSKTKILYFPCLIQKIFLPSKPKSFANDIFLKIKTISQYSFKTSSVQNPQTPHEPSFR